MLVRNQAKNTLTADPVFHAQTETGQAYYSDSRLLLLELDREVIPRAAGTDVAGKMSLKDVGAIKAEVAPER